MRQPTEHELKCWPEYYRALASGEKTFELRVDDRNFRAGDVLRIREWRRLRIVDGRAEGEYTGREILRTVTYVLSGIGLQPGWVCMGLGFMLSRVVWTAVGPVDLAAVSDITAALSENTKGK